VNERQKMLIPEKILRHFSGDRAGESRPLAGKTIAVWGLSFKPRTDDMREAPSIVVIERLLAEGASVRAHDPEAVKEAQKIFGDRIAYSCSSPYDILAGADALAIVTEWNEYRNPDFERIAEQLRTPVIFDGRNLYNPRRLKEMGFIYHGIGRNGSGFVEK
jgi:UDPglucose 6-dehydrogenase